MINATKKSVSDGIKELKDNGLIEKIDGEYGYVISLNSNRTVSTSNPTVTPPVTPRCLPSNPTVSTPVTVQLPPSNPTVTPPVTPRLHNTESSYRTDIQNLFTEEEEKTPPPFFSAWNDMALECGLAKANVTDERKRALKVRMNTAIFRDNWQKALAKIPESNFMRGDNDRGWKADIDWFLSPKSLPKILEGKYDNRGRQNEITEAIRKAQEEIDDENPF